MTLSEGILQQKLAQPFRYYPRVTSTNDLAKTWLMQGAPAGAVVIADEQVSGRGRKGGRVWRTPPNSALALSVILRPPAALLARVNMIGALCVYELAAQVGCDNVGIKWPNDIQVQDRKISGVLVEAVWMQDNLDGVVLGIGVNVRVDFSQTDLRDSAASLEDLAGHPLDRAELIRILLERVEYWYQLIDNDEVYDAWRGRLNMLGHAVVAEGISCRAFDVTAGGALLIEDGHGGVHKISAGDVSVFTGQRSLV